MSPARWIAGLLAVAFGLRLGANLWLTIPTPEIVADSMWYHASATLLAEGHGYIHHFTGQPTAAWPPGYPAILALLYRLFGSDPSRAFALNAVAGTCTCYLAGRIARAMTDTGRGTQAQILATALVALLPSHVLFTSLVMSETVFTTMLCALVLMAIALVRRSTQAVAWKGWLGWSLLVGLASLVRVEAVVLLAPPVVVLAIGRSPRLRPGTIALLAGVLGLGVLTAELPWLVRNLDVFGHVVPVSSSFGRTFLIGRNPVADGDMNLYSPDPQADQRDLLHGGPAGELAVDRRLRDEGLRYMLEHPGRELALVPRRLASMYRNDRVWGEWYRPADPARVPPGTVHALGTLSSAFYWAVLLLALPGLVTAFTRPRPAQRIVVLTVVSWTGFFVLLLYGSARFHFPLMPLLCAMAASTLVGVVGVLGVFGWPPGRVEAPPTVQASRGRASSSRVAP